MASSNPFALLAAEDDGSDSEQVLPKQSKPVAVDAAPKAGKPTRGGDIPKATTSRRTVPGQTTVRPQKEAKELPASDAPAGDRAQFEGERGRDDRGTGFGRGRGRGAERGGRGRGEGRGRGGRGRAGGERPDRRSQTGRTDSEKQEHQGWGGDDGKRELEAEVAGVTDAAAEKAVDPVTPAPEGETAAAAEEAPKTPAEPEDNSKTYDEYLKEQRAAGRGAIDGLALEARKANEGSDDSQWKDGVLVANEETAYFAGKEKKEGKSKQRKEKTLLEVEFSAPSRPGQSERGRGGARGGRGAPRGRGGDTPRARGAGRGGRGRGGASANGINISDSSAFPSLAA